MNESSSPSSVSSSRIRFPPEPSSFFSITRAIKSLAASASGARKTPLPAHNPSALITTGQFTFESAAVAARADLYVPYIFAVGILCRVKNSLEKILLPSSCAAFFEGPTIAQFRFRNASVNPFTSGRSEDHTSELQSLAYLVCRLLL